MLCTQETLLWSLLSMDKGIEGRWRVCTNKLCCNLCYLWVKVLKEYEDYLQINSDVISAIYG